METHYIGHDSVYQKLKANGAFGWTSEEDQTQVVRPRVLQVIDQLAIAPNSRVLDLGCGTGDLAIWLSQCGYDAYGIDIAPSAIAWAKEKAMAQNAPVELTVGSVLDLSPYPDEFFHLVVDGRCLHCIIGPDRVATLTSIHRVLRSGGGFFLQSMCGEVRDASPMKSQFDPVSRCTISDRGIATRYIGQAEDILRELRSAGFEIDHWEISPRISEDDQDDLLVRAVKR